MDYEKKYNEALEKARQLCAYPTTKPFISDLQDLFPELAESEDELTWLTNYIAEEAYYLSMDIRGNEDRIKLQKLQKSLAWLEKQGKQIEINLVEILKHYPRETELYSPLYGKLWLAEVDEEHEIITCYKHHLEEGCTRAVLEQEDTVSFYSNGTTGLPDFSVSKDCMLFLYDNEKQDEKRVNFTKIIGEPRKATGVLKEMWDEMNFDSCNGCVNRKGCVNCESGELRETELRSDNEPKFKVGDWIINRTDATIMQIVNNEDFYESVEIGGQRRTDTYNYVEWDFRLWTIQDAKEGDVLVCKGNIKYSNGIKYEKICLFNNLDNAFFTLTKLSNFVEEYDIDVRIDYPDNTVPATKEQRDTLIKAMTGAGYTFDFEKKELKKIEQSPIEEVNGEDYGIDSLYHAQRILEKTLGSVDGYQSDDGILDHKAAITAVKKLYEQKPAWSGDDEKFFITALWHISNSISNGENTDIQCDTTKWLKSLKDRIGCEVNCTTTKEWSEEDMSKVQRICKYLNEAKKYYADITEVRECVEWLKSLRPQKQWKPSDEQMEALRKASKNEYLTAEQYDILVSIYDDLKKLEE